MTDSSTESVTGQRREFPDRIVCDQWGNWWRPEDTYEEDVDDGVEYVRADANLIAVAPSLLIACQEQAKLIDAQQKMLIAYRIGKTPADRVINLLGKRDNIVQMATTAIAKAKEADE